jgi:hypothetical protein
MLLYIITNFCAPHTNVNQEACRKFMEAGTYQTGVAQTLEQTQKQTFELSKKIVTRTTGDKIWVVTFFAYKVAKDKAINYTFRTKFPITTSLEPKKAYISVGVAF